MGIMSLVTRAFSLLKNHHILRSTIGGALFGLIGVALPLTMFTGSDQLHTALQNAATLGVGLLIAVLLGKMLAFSVSLASGFVGGVIFPLLFIGGISGMIINQLFADVPLGLAFACLLAAVPGSLIAAPFTMVLLTALVTEMGALQTAPVLIAATTAYLTMWRVRTLLEKRKQPSTTDVNRQ
jgi:H+/Cl- antiporter ClcA